MSIQPAWQQALDFFGTPLASAPSAGPRAWRPAGVTRSPEVDRADRLNAGAIDKGLEVGLLRDVGLNRAPVPALLAEADLLQRGDTRIAAVCLDLIHLPRNFSAFGCVHVHSSVSTRCSDADVGAHAHRAVVDGDGAAHSASATLA